MEGSSNLGFSMEPQKSINCPAAYLETKGWERRPLDGWLNVPLQGHRGVRAVTGTQGRWEHCKMKPDLGQDPRRIVRKGEGFWGLRGRREHLAPWKNSETAPRAKGQRTHASVWFVLLSQSLKVLFPPG